MNAEANGPVDELGAFDDSTGDLHVIIESPKGCRNKYTYEPNRRLFVLTGILPLGASFPFDFGFIPGTVGGDGDPLDVLVLMEEPAFVGVLVPSRLIGVIKAEQTEKGVTERNDRLIAVATASRTHSAIQTLSDLDQSVVDEIEHFFVSYDAVKGKNFKPLGRYGRGKARAIVDAACICPSIVSG
ncbi:MAG: inorganic diphosphatase [Pyrinomonadaceae bacterium]